MDYCPERLERLDLGKQFFRAVDGTDYSAAESGIKIDFYLHQPSMPKRP